MKKRIIVFNGMHSAGKTELATILAKNNKAHYHYEIGRKLHSEVDYHSLTSFDDYDTEIMRRELERDRELLLKPELPIVETWHVGDMAYAMQRSPSVIPLWNEKLQEALRVFDPLCILVKISDETFRKRGVRGEIMDDFEEMLLFYKKLSRDTVQIYKAFNIPYVEISNDGELAETLSEITKRIQG